MRYEKLGFITAEEILELAQRLAPEYLENVVRMVNEGEPIVTISYNEQNSEQSEGSFTPEISFERKRRIFTRVDGNIYTESKEFFHIIQAHTQGLTIQGYLENLLSMAAESERIAKKQEEKLGGIEEGRINNE